MYCAAARERLISLVRVAFLLCVFARAHTLFCVIAQRVVCVYSREQRSRVHRTASVHPIGLGIKWCSAALSLPCLVCSCVCLHAVKNGAGECNQRKDRRRDVRGGKINDAYCCELLVREMRPQKIPWMWGEWKDTAATKQREQKSLVPLDDNVFLWE